MQRIGKYKIVGELGQGGMGMVYEALDLMIGRKVAIKVVHEHALRNPQIKQRFYREARSAGRLTHENIMVLYDIAEHDGLPYIVMELLSGSDLRALLSQPGLLSLEDKLSIARQICEGLAYAHEHQIVHRDVKPDNIRVLENGRVKIMDFGIARIQSEARTLTLHNTSIGTPRYMSPEQIKGEAIDHRTDIFSFGVLFYEMLMGVNPFDGDHVTAIIYKVLSEHPEPINLADSPFSDDLQRIVEKCLEKDRGVRYQHFDEVLNDLLELVPSPTHVIRTIPQVAPSKPTPPDETIIEDAATLFSTQSTAARRHTSEKKRGRRWPVAAAVVLLMGLITGGYVAWNATGYANTNPDSAFDASTRHEPWKQPASPGADSLLPLPTNSIQAGDASITQEPLQEQEPPKAGNSSAEPRQLAVQQRDTPPERAEPPSQSASSTTPTTKPRQKTPPPEQREASSPTPADPPAQAGTAATDATRTDTHDAKPAASEAPRNPSSYAYRPGPERQTQPDDTADGYSQQQPTHAYTNEAARARPTEASAHEAVHGFIGQYKRALEDERLESLQALFANFSATDTQTWAEFFRVAEDIQVEIRPLDVRVDGDQATVDIRLDITYRDNKKRRQKSTLPYAWTLVYTGNRWSLTNTAGR